MEDRKDHELNHKESELEDRNVTPNSDSGEMHREKNAKGIVLIPTPSNDPHNPLNWPQWKKILILAVMCLATFTGLAAAVSNNLALVAMAKTYHTTPTTASYTVSASIGGLIVGPLLLVPLAPLFGVSSCSFWSLIIVVATSIWSGESTGPHGYTSFAVARGIAGIFAGIPQILTGGMISSMFFLHERGKAFAIYSTIYVVATIAGPTFSGFIVQHTHWSVTQWWCVGSNALSAILIFLFVEETGYNRDPRAIHQFPRKKQSWIGNRIATFFPGTQVVPVVQASKILKSSIAPFAIGLSPITICAGLYTLANFSWFVTISIELPIQLQEPFEPKKDVFGYGFSPQQNAAWTFALWFGGILAVLYGVVFNDRIPLMLARRRGGWHPELRLHTSWFPGLIVAPIGLGVLAAGLHHHWHYMVLAVASFLVTFGAVASVPVSLNYVIESFKSYPQEVGACLNVYRITLSLTIPFYYETWEEAVGIQWVYGIMAFLSLGVFALVILLMFKGKSLRRFNLLRDSEVEE